MRTKQSDQRHRKRANNASAKEKYRAKANGKESPLLIYILSSSQKGDLKYDFTKELSDDLEREKTKNRDLEKIVEEHEVRDPTYTTTIMPNIRNK